MKSFILLLFFAAVAASADPIKEMDNKAFSLCKHRKDVRTLSVRVDKDGACTTFYSKFGSAHPIGTGRNLDSCMKFMSNVKTNLEKSGFTCRDVTGSTITSTVE